MKLNTDYALHTIFCASCAITTSLIMSTIVDTPLPAILSGFISGLCLGIGKEYGDSKAQGNEWSWGDILYDIIGAMIGSMGGFINLLINL